MSTNTNHRCATLLIILHWLMLLVIILAYASIELTDIFPRRSALSGSMMTAHFVTGLSVLWLVLLRILLRLMISHTPSAEPPIETTFTQWQKRLAHYMHLALYLWMLALPLVGWLLLNAKGHVTPYFGVELPALIGPNANLAEILEEVHEALASMGYVLIGLHTVAAMLHHYIAGDNILTRMLPPHVERRPE